MNYQKIISSKVKSVKPSGIRRFFDIASNMDGVISLGVGEPDLKTPWQIRSAGIRSLEQSKTRYTSNGGLMDLRKEISAYTKSRCGVEYSPADEVLVTVGGSEAIDLAIRALIDPGDEVIIPQPSYVCYEPITALAGGVPVIINTRAENDFKITAEELSRAISNKTKLLILPYPSNPTGAIMEKDDLIAISEVLSGTDVMIISDEIYSELTFGTEHVSPCSIPKLRERVITVNGFSKAFSMTGWRLGYALAPAEIMKEIIKIHQYAIMCAPTTSQHAAIEALRKCENDVSNMRDEYDMRRRFIVDGFRRIGMPCREPKGAFYAFPSIKHTGLSSEEFCERLLFSKKVALVPGNAFGESGEGFVRASYCYSMSHIKEALSRIEDFLSTLQ